MIDGDERGIDRGLCTRVYVSDQRRVMRCYLTYSVMYTLFLRLVLYGTCITVCLVPDDNSTAT